MFKSILLIFAGGMLLATPLAMAGRGARQTPQSPAPSNNAASSTPVVGQASPAGPAVPDDMTNPVVKPTADQQAKAKQLYSIDCAMCHGDNGNGKSDLATSMKLTLPDFTDPKSLANAKDGELFNQIRNGKGSMPGEEKGRASDTEVWNLVLYVRNFSKPQPAGAPAH